MGADSLTRGLLNNSTCKLLGRNELQVEGLGLVVEVLEPARDAGRRGGKGFGFVVGLPAHDQRPEDPRQFVRPHHDAFGFAQSPF